MLSHVETLMDQAPSRPFPEVFPFVLVGVLGRIDIAGRCLRLAGQEMRVASDVDLGDVRVGMRVVVTGMRESVTGQATVVGVIPVGVVTPCETPASLEDRTLIPLLVTLLMEHESEIEVLDCHLLPADDRYAVRLAIPGELGKEVYFPRPLLERADVDPVARHRMGLLLTAAVRILRARPAINDSRGASRAARPATRVPSQVDLRCERCEQPLASDDPVVVEGDLPHHLTCPSPRRSG
jgi:hypothetical protein